MNQTIGFIGGGNMATSLIGGLIKTGKVKPEQIKLFEPNTDKAKDLANTYGIQITASNFELLEQAAIVVIAVKPQVLQSVVTPLAEAFKNNKPLIVSVVAGITVSCIEQWLDSEHAVVRVMPNTPALVGMGASGLFANTRVSSEQRADSQQLVDAIGKSAWVESEQQIDAITALSGSGPAYFMLFIQSLIDAAIAAGIDANTAKTLAVQTAAGSASLIESSDDDLKTLIDNVTSPGGTTEQALLSFQQSELPSIVDKAFKAAQQRSIELSKELA